MQNAQIHLYLDSDRKAQIAKWAHRRGLTVAALLNSAVNFYVASVPVEGYHDESALSKRLAARKEVTDDGANSQL